MKNDLHCPCGAVDQVDELCELCGFFVEAEPQLVEAEPKDPPFEHFISEGAFAWAIAIFFASGLVCASLILGAP